MNEKRPIDGPVILSSFAEVSRLLLYGGSDRAHFRKRLAHQAGPWHTVP